MEPKKLIRSTKAQLKFLVDYMSLNIMFANGEYTGSYGARRVAEEWEQLRGLLREYGPDKSVEQWKQTWRDVKRRARKEKAEAQSNMARIGNSSGVAIVSDTTMKVLDTIGHDSSTDSVPVESHIGKSSPPEYIEKKIAAMDKYINSHDYTLPSNHQETKPRSFYEQRKDEFSIFGETIANELREIRHDNRHLIILKKEIMDLVYRTKLRILPTECKSDDENVTDPFDEC